MSIDLRCGDWRVALADITQVDCLICDPPYSERTHEGVRVNVFDSAKSNRYAGGGPRQRAAIEYPSWTVADVKAFVSGWMPRVRGWFVAITDHVLAPAFEAALLEANRYVFQPLPFVEIGKQPRLAGDGPASWTCWIMVARPRERRFQTWGSLPGGYVPPPSIVGMRGGRPIKGGKPLWLMQQLVRDYSRPGDLVCDPCAGGATTLIAAAIEGRRAVGAELDPTTYRKAQARIAKGYTVNMWAQHEARAEQVPMFEADK